MNLYKIVLSLVLVVSGSGVVAMDKDVTYPRYFEMPNGRIIEDCRQYNKFGVPCDTPPAVERYPVISATKKNRTPENYKNPLNQQNTIERFFGFIYGGLDQIQDVAVEKLAVDVVVNHLSINVDQDVENSPTSTLVQFSPDNKTKIKIKNSFVDGNSLCQTIVPFYVAKGILKQSKKVN